MPATVMWRRARHHFAVGRQREGDGCDQFPANNQSGESGRSSLVKRTAAHRAAQILREFLSLSAASIIAGSNRKGKGSVAQVA